MDGLTLSSAPICKVNVVMLAQNVVIPAGNETLRVGMERFH